MNKITLYVDVEGLVAKNRSQDQIIISRNESYQIHFNFDRTWTLYDKKIARFIWNGEHQDVEFTGNICPVPEIHGAPSITVGVYIEDVIRTSTGAKLFCHPSILCHESKQSAGEAERYRNEAKEAAAAAVKARNEVLALLGHVGGTTWTEYDLVRSGNTVSANFHEGFQSGTYLVRAAGADGVYALGIAGYDSSVQNEPQPFTIYPAGAASITFTYLLGPEGTIDASYVTLSISDRPMDLTKLYLSKIA